MFRCLVQERHCVAGIGASGAKYVVGKKGPGGPAVTLASVGGGGSLSYGSGDSLRVECLADRIALLVNNVPVLVAAEDSHLAGPRGSRA